MSERVIDALELVEVDIQGSETLSRQLRVLDQPLHASHQPFAIGKSCKRVEVRQPINPFLGALALGDIANAHGRDQ